MLSLSSCMQQGVAYVPFIIGNYMISVRSTDCIGATRSSLFNLEIRCTPIRENCKGSTK